MNKLKRDDALTIKEISKRVTLSEGLPTQVWDSPWVVAWYNECYPYPESTPYVGKWMFFPSEKVDLLWINAIDQLAHGKFGRSIKISSASRVSERKDGVYVFCVYTYDARDMKDVERVLSGLREMGLEGCLVYKLDAATKAGKYAANGDKNTTIYKSYPDMPIKISALWTANTEKNEVGS